MKTVGGEILLGARASIKYASVIFAPSSSLGQQNINRPFPSIHAFKTKKTMFCRKLEEAEKEKILEYLLSTMTPFSISPFLAARGNDITKKCNRYYCLFAAMQARVPSFCMPLFFSITREERENDEEQKKEEEHDCAREKL